MGRESVSSSLSPALAALNMRSMFLRRQRGDLGLAEDARLATLLVRHHGFADLSARALDRAQRRRL